MRYTCSIVFVALISIAYSQTPNCTLTLTPGRISCDGKSEKCFSNIEICYWNLF